MIDENMFASNESLKEYNKHEIYNNENIRKVELLDRYIKMTTMAFLCVYKVPWHISYC